MTKIIRILDVDKFGYVLETCRYYGIQFEEVTDDHILASSEPGAGEAEGKRTLHIQRNGKLSKADRATG